MTQRDGCPGRAAHVQFRDAREILSHVENKNSGLRFGQLDGLDYLIGLDWWSHLRDELSLRRGNNLRGLPGGIVEAGFVPTGNFQACVVILAAVNAVEPN